MRSSELPKPPATAAVDTAPCGASAEPTASMKPRNETSLGPCGVVAMLGPRRLIRVALGLRRSRCAQALVRRSSRSFPPLRSASTVSTLFLLRPVAPPTRLKCSRLLTHVAQRERGRSQTLCFDRAGGGDAELRVVAVQQP